MWYEVLPSMIIIGTLSALPFHLSPYINKFFIGNPQVRNFETPMERLGYARDYEQGGDKHWNANGLDAIPDK